jgi:uncharacterized protein (DUF433 family)
MAIASLPVQHIRVDENGREWVDDTTYRVVDVALDQLVHGWSPEEIHFQHYGRLSMSQIHAALAYYYDNRERLDAEIRQTTAEVASMRESASPSPFLERMRAAGRLR